ncbi:glycosyltransferase [Neisseria leonii]|uniref:glycosyltransferase n=1 Tax=Neisseria leonii TaxID=2995413 RepID=UPI0030CBCECA
MGSIAGISGTEKVFVDMANAMTVRGHRVYAVWNDAPGVVPHYPFSADVRQYNLGLGKIRIPLSAKLMREVEKRLRIYRMNPADAFKVRQLAAAVRENVPLNEIDVFVCFEFNSVMAANRLAGGGGRPVAAMVHNSVGNQIARLTPWQRREADKADVYQVLLPGFVAQAKRFLSTEIVCIGNAVPQVEERDCADLAAHRPPFKIVTVGRIEPEQKQTLVLVRAFAEIARDYPDWQLHYYGPVSDAAYHHQIRRYIDHHGLPQQILYGGTTQDVLSVLRTADIFGFPSAHEGFSLALTEAMAAGLPAVGFAAAEGVNDLIEDGVNGLLAKDEAGFAQCLASLMRDAGLRRTLGRAAHESMKVYSPDSVWQQWEQLLAGLVARRRR